MYKITITCFFTRTKFLPLSVLFNNIAEIQLRGMEVFIIPLQSSGTQGMKYTGHMMKSLITIITIQFIVGKVTYKEVRSECPLWLLVQGAPVSYAACLHVLVPGYTLAGQRLQTPKHGSCKHNQSTQI